MHYIDFWASTKWQYFENVFRAAAWYHAVGRGKNIFSDARTENSEDLERAVRNLAMRLDAF